MQNFLRRPKAQETLVDQHHDLLSRPKKEDKGLLAQLRQFQPVDPLDLILNEEPLPQSAVLNHVRVEPLSTPVMPAKAKPPVANTVILESGKRLSECLLWQMQIDYYQNMGIAAWEQSVPCFITSNAFIGDAYADMIMAFLRDYLEHLHRDEPIYIVELATGTGRFSSHLAREVQRKAAQFAQLRDLKLRYVMTDFTEDNIRFWEGHETLQPHIESGFLDFAVLNPLEMQSITLRRSGAVVGKDTVKNPVIAIANYFFDSIPVDVFRVENKRLSEGLVTLVRNVEGVEPESKPHISQIKTTWNYRELPSENVYDDARLNAVLRWYKHNAKKGTVLFPVGAFDVVRNLQVMSNNQLVLLSSDKAYTRMEHMFCFDEHNFAIHDGAFSYMVNYHALGRFFENEGGQFLATTPRNLTLQTVCGVQVSGQCDFENLKYFYNERMNRTLPITSTCETQSPLYDPEGFRPLQWIDMHLSYLRLGLCDPKVFTLTAPKILDLWQHITTGQLYDLQDLMEIGWQQFYFYRGEPNMLFWFGQLWHRMGEFEKSNMAFQKTSDCYGEHHALYFLMGQNMLKLNRKAEAIALYEKALALEPSFQEAIDGLAELRK